MFNLSRHIFLVFGQIPVNEIPLICVQLCQELLKKYKQERPAPADRRRVNTPGTKVCFV